MTTRERYYIDYPGYFGMEKEGGKRGSYEGSALRGDSVWSADVWHVIDHFRKRVKRKGRKRRTHVVYLPAQR